MSVVEEGPLPAGERKRGVGVRLAQLAPLALLLAFYATRRNGPWVTNYPVQSPQQEQQSFQLPPGYHLQLVLSEPEILEPVTVAFDGDGRMFVAEMRTYMQDLDARNELTPGGRVSIHWSSKGDGVYDRHSVFADHLVLPRMLLPLDRGQVVIGESNSEALTLYTDTKGAGVSDQKAPWFPGRWTGGNVETQPSGLTWAIDNGIYTTFHTYRLRWTPQGVVEEPSTAGLGQWGVSQDDFGKLYFTNAGGERGPVSFQQPICYGAFNPKEQLAPGFEEVWPAIGLGDAEGGPRRNRSTDGTLNHFTSSAGSQIFRGDRLPQELRGDFFFGEPVGRLVRRAKVETHDGLTVLSNPYQPQKSEFLRSTDPYFRPVSVTTAPDGTLYIVDMYRGIIQEGAWTRPGSYVRKVIERFHLDKVVGHGRIWRLVHDSASPGPAPAMLSESATDLVAHLRHPNGWWRDTAQKLLILRQDRSALPALEEMAAGDPNLLARIHALWTLDGLQATKAELLLQALSDPQPQVRIAAVRIGESLQGEAAAAWKTAVMHLAGEANADVAIQVMLTANRLQWPEREIVTAQAISTHPAATTIREIASSLQNAGSRLPSRPFTADQMATLHAGAEIFHSLCATCHGEDARGVNVAGADKHTRVAPTLAGTKIINGPAEGPIRVLLQGLTGPIDGKSYTGVMVSMAANNDEWIASVLSYVRTAFDNHGGFVTPEEVARLRAATRDRLTAWTDDELDKSIPQSVSGKKNWRATANPATGSPEAAVDNNEETEYTTGIPQAAGQWFQVELPKETAICGMAFDCLRSPDNYPRAYTVELSHDGKAWTPAIARAAGDGAITHLRFAAEKAMYVRIRLTENSAEAFWTINELQLYAPAKEGG